MIAHLLRRHVRFAVLATAIFAAVGVNAQVPTITANPLPLSVGPDDRAGFSVTATGATPLAYQWFHDGAPVAGATTDVLLLPNAQLADAGNYAVHISNRFGATISKAAELKIASYTKTWIDPTFNTSADGPVALLQDGGMLVREANFQTLVRVDKDAKPDPTFSFVPPSTAFTHGIVETIAVQDDGQILVSGSLAWISHYAPMSYSYFFLRLNPNGSADPTFIPVTDRPVIIIPVGQKAIVTIEGKLARLNADGSLDPTFSSVAVQAPDGAALPINQAVMDAKNRLWVSSGRYLWRIKSNGERDDSFPLVDANGEIGEIVVKGESVYVGAIVNVSVDAEFSATYHLKRFNSVGIVDPTFAEFSCALRGATTSFAVQSDNRVLVAGDFDYRAATDQSGREIRRVGTLRLMADGKMDLSFAPPDLVELGSSVGWYLPVDPSHALLESSGKLRRILLNTSGPIDAPRVLKVASDSEHASAGDDVTIRVTAVGAGPLNIFGTDVRTTLSGDQLTFHNVQQSPELIVDGPGGRVTQVISLAVLPSAPKFADRTGSIVARLGQFAELKVLARGTFPMTVEWLKDGVSISGPQNMPLWREGEVELSPFVDSTVAGIYTARVTNAFGTAETSIPVSIGKTSELSNLSVRAQVGTGDEVMIVGFIFENQKQVLFQAVGPELANYGVAGTLGDPTATLFASDGTQVVNDNGGVFTPWNDPYYRDIGGMPLVRPETRSSELRCSVPGGVNSIVVSGNKSTTGVALAQIFAADGGTTRMQNLSARVFAGKDSATAIVGFIIRGDAPRQVLIRCIGPGLVAAGLSKALMDPLLTLVDQSTHLTVTTNDNWESAPDRAALVDAMHRVGAFPLPSGSKDAAMLVTLPPGGYTALVSGAGGTTGLVLLEVYDVPEK